MSNRALSLGAYAAMFIENMRKRLSVVVLCMSVFASLASVNTSDAKTSFPIRPYTQPLGVYPFSVLFHSGKHIRSGLNKAPGSLAGFKDSAEFIMYAKEAPIGAIFSSLDGRGNYHRKFTITMAGQTVEMKMVIIPDKKGVWKIIEIDNPALGVIRAAREDSTANYSEKGKPVSIRLPAEYVLYDDNGMIFESLMIRRYDMKIRGKQTFTRFRIPETIPGNTISVELEFIGEDNLPLKGRTERFKKFKYSALGQMATYWVDKDFRIVMSDSPSVQAYIIRKGYEELALYRKVETAPSSKEVEKMTVMIPMRDGVKLATDLYFPVKRNGKYPVILIRSPYKKEMSELDGTYYARRGYVAAIQDVRGRFASEGVWEPLVNEGDDGYDTVEWLASQEWSTGKTGMIGASYLGWTQLLAAVRKPPHLTTIIPNVTPPDPFFNIPYEYGSFFLQGAAWWLEVLETKASADITMKTFSDIDSRDYGEILKSLPVVDIDKKIFGGENRIWRKWIQHNSQDSYWDKGSYLDKLKDLDIPVFLQSGWFDSDGIGSKLAYLELKKSKNRNIKLILGPWGHTDQASSALTGRNSNQEAAVDLQDMYNRWFDFWLKDRDIGIVKEPLVQLYIMNTEKWLTADIYPLPRTVFSKLYLSSTLGANTLGGDGKLVWTLPEGGKPYDEYTFNPADPTPAWIQRAKKDGRRGYEQVTSNRSDILVFTSEPFQRQVTIAGPMTAFLYASTTAVDTDWFVTFIALNEKGSPLPLGNQLGKGCIRARFRNSVRFPEFLESGKIYAYTIDLWHTGIAIPKGWRLRVEITSAFFPYFSRNLNTGGNNESDTKFVSAKQKVFHSQEFPSHILLPVILEE
jgi:uncharacterized protein